MTKKKSGKNDLIENEELSEDNDELAEENLDEVAGGNGGPLRYTRSGDGNQGQTGGRKSTLAGGGRPGDPTISSFEWNDVLE